MRMFLSGQTVRHIPRRVMAFSLMLVSGLSVVVSPQAQLDVCGCRNNPGSLGSFDSADAATYPPGATFPSEFTMDIPLPADGVMVFNHLNLVPRPQFGGGLTIRFIRNAANTPVTLLVSGNVTIGPLVTLAISGTNGVVGYELGVGGLGGPGGFRGGDGAYQLVNFARMGGAGSGPAGRYRWKRHLFCGG